MTRRLPVQPLRGSDPTLLEIQIPEMLRRPIGQIAPVNMMDLIQLAVTEGRPKGLDRALQAFVDGLGRQVADIPKGSNWDQFLDELDELQGHQVPYRFREMLAEEAHRDNRAGPRVRALLERWGQEEPEAFPLNLVKARVQRAEISPPPRRGDGTGAPRERAPRGSGEDRPSRAASAGPKPPPKAKPIQDIDRHNFLRDQCVERLARAAEKGLAEVVLIAGVRHAAKEEYPDVTPVEIVGVLRSLGGQVRSSAGRWMLTARF